MLKSISAEGTAPFSRCNDDRSRQNLVKRCPNLGPAIFLVAITFACGCDVEVVWDDQENAEGTHSEVVATENHAGLSSTSSSANHSNSTTPQPVMAAGAFELAQDSVHNANSATAASTQQYADIKIASFNIQVFGQSKLKKPGVMPILADVARRFDIMAIQEVRSKSQNVLPEFVKLINASGAQYSYVIGPRQGRSSSKEQYAIVFDTTRIELLEAGFIVPDPNDLLHREPMVSQFRVRGPPAESAFTFSLVNIHTDPDDTRIELDALADSFTWVRQNVPHEDDIIVLGDLNVDSNHLGRLGQLPNMNWTVANVATNTRGTKSYDNLVFDASTTSEFRQVSGVFNLMAEYGITMEQALTVSDHMPVWAVFSATEMGPSRVALQPGAARSQ